MALNEVIATVKGDEGQLGLRLGLEIQLELEGVVLLGLLGDLVNFVLNLDHF